MTLSCFPSPRALAPPSRPSLWNCNALARRPSTVSSEGTGHSRGSSGGSLEAFDFGWNVDGRGAADSGTAAEQGAGVDIGLDFYESAALPLGIDLDAMKVHYNPACEEEGGSERLSIWRKGCRRSTSPSPKHDGASKRARKAALPRLAGLFFPTSAL